MCSICDLHKLIQGNYIKRRLGLQQVVSKFLNELAKIIHLATLMSKSVFNFAGLVDFWRNQYGLKLNEEKKDCRLKNNGSNGHTNFTAECCKFYKIKPTHRKTAPYKRRLIRVLV